jgi:hypothetical protein
MCVLRILFSEKVLTSSYKFLETFLPIHAYYGPSVGEVCL